MCTVAVARHFTTTTTTTTRPAPQHGERCLITWLCHCAQPHSERTQNTDQRVTIRSAPRWFGGLGGGGDRHDGEKCEAWGEIECVSVWERGEERSDKATGASPLCLWEPSVLTYPVAFLAAAVPVKPLLRAGQEHSRTGRYGPPASHRCGGDCSRGSLR